MTAKPTVHDLAQMIDHSLLHPTIIQAEVLSGCQLSARYNAATACVKPCHVSLAYAELGETGVRVSTVAGFPHGNSTARIKVQEAEEAVLAGAAEVDMVVNIGEVLSENWEFIHDEITMVNDAVVSNGGILKVIFENDYLEDTHIIRLAELCTQIGVAFIKTSTGYGFVKRDNGMYAYDGAQDHHLQLMRKHAGTNVQIKAAGGIRTLDDLLRVRGIGVTRIGATATESILQEAKSRGFEN